MRRRWIGVLGFAFCVPENPSPMQDRFPFEGSPFTGDRWPSIHRPPYNSWRVGRKRISFTSTSSGSPMAKATARANDSAGIAVCS